MRYAVYEIMKNRKNRKDPKWRRKILELQLYSSSLDSSSENSDSESESEESDGWAGILEEEAMGTEVDFLAALAADCDCQR
jgi:U3 small nucleolar RNA-associated protein 14